MNVAILGLLLAPALAAQAVKYESVPPELAEAIGQQMLGHYNQVQDFQAKFRSEKRPNVDGAPADRRWRDGVYAYLRGGYELLTYEETSDGHGETLRWTYVRTPQSLRGWHEDAKSGVRSGSIQQVSRLNFRLPWSPSRFLLLDFFEQEAFHYLTDGDYTVRAPRGSNDAAQVVFNVKALVSPDQLAKGASRISYTLHLSREHGLAPLALERYGTNGKDLETRLDLAEVRPGLWLAEHGVTRQLAPAGDGPYRNGVVGEFWVEPGSVRVNQGLTPAFFEQDFPAGTRVVDRLKNTSYTQGLEGDKKDVKELSRLAEEIAARRPRPRGPVALRSTAGLLVGLNAAIFGTIAVLLLARRRGHRSAGDAAARGGATGPVAESAP